MDMEELAELTATISLIRTALDESEDAFCVTNADLDNLEILFISDAQCKLTGYSQDEIVGSSPKMFQGKNTEPKICKSIRDCLEDGKSANAVITNYTKSGEEYKAELHINPIFSKTGEIVGFVSLQRKHHNLLKTMRDLQKDIESKIRKYDEKDDHE